MFWMLSMTLTVAYFKKNHKKHTGNAAQILKLDLAIFQQQTV
jgi:hypothetical protein